VLVFLGMLVPTNTKLTHVFGSKVLVLVLVCYKLTLTPPSKHDHCSIKSTRNRKRLPRRSMAKVLPVNGWEHRCRGSDYNVELIDTQSNETSSLRGLAKHCLHCILKPCFETNLLYLLLPKQLDPLPFISTHEKQQLPTHRHHSRSEMDSMTWRRTLHPPSPLLGLPRDLHIEIAAHVGATSEWPLADLCSLHGTCSTMHSV
jgi:hypothetical protein